MTPFQRLSKRIVERARGIYYEGPEPPGRLGAMVVAFANLHPHATRGEWVAFATEHAGECYRSGYTRGHERSERDYAATMPDARPEDVADDQDPDWRWSPEVELGVDPEEPVLEANDDERLAAKEAADYFDAVVQRNERSRP